MISGWNAVASTAPCRTATARPAAAPADAPDRVLGGTVASTSTCGPADSTHGARMNTARTGSPGTPSNRRSVSKESTWRPNALRRTTTSSPPSWRWSGRPSRISDASRIIPAHDP